MKNLDYKQFTQRHRPHFHPPDRILFVTYRLAGSIPVSTIRQYKAKKEWLEKAFKQAQKKQSEISAEAKPWLNKLEKFKREWFIRF